MCKRLIVLTAIALVTTVTSLVTADVPDPDLVGWWKFEDGYGGVAKDSSGNGLDATVLGNPKWDRSGRHRGILVLDGIDDHLRIDGTSLRLPLYSMAMWFRVDGGSGVRDVLSVKGPSGVNGVLLEITATGTLRYLHRFPFAATGGNNIYTTAAYADGAWHHVAAVKSAKEMMLYVDGQLVGPQADTTQFEGPLGDIWIGTLDQRMQRLLPGAVDDVRFYDRVLSEQEIKTVMEGQTDPFAYGPQPGNGATYAQTWAVLEWGPGDLAISHNVYFGDSMDAVRDATPENKDVFRGSTTETSFRIGMAGAPYPTGLPRGKTYYWRIDEVNSQQAESPWKGEVWSFTVPPEIAWKPVPAQGARFVDPNADLSWKAGVGGVLYNVYFGADFNTLDAATVPQTMTAQPTFDPGPMGSGKTYFWRVDQFDGTAWHKGDVWSFTVATPGGGLKGEYFNNVDLAGEPVLVRTDPKIDFDFGDGSPQTGVVNPDGFSVRWTGELEIAFSETYTFYVDADNGVRLWINDRLIIDQWSAFRRNEHRSKPVDLVTGQEYSIVMEYNEQDGPAAARLFWESASQPKDIILSAAFSLPVRAILPRPANGTVDVGQMVSLTWKPGDQAAHHDVYFGKDRQAVADATAKSTSVYQGRQDLDATSFDPGTLEWNTPYFWRIDEVNEANPDSPWKGPVWSFTTANFIVVDDFESYTDEEGSRIYETWIDGWTNSTGSVVGYLQAPFAERQIVHGGTQSLPLAYDNAGQAMYSEIERTWATPQNWTINDVNTLSLHFRGAADNAQGSLYVAIEDSAGRVGVAVHANPDAVLAGIWTQWQVPLAELSSTGVNMMRVKKMYIGIGNRNKPAAGGAGRIYIDDIRVTKA